MSAEESYGSHSLTSFAAQLERTIPQSPQLKKMAPRRKHTGTAKDLPPELYEKLKTPERETADDRKKRVQKITREWAKRWVAYQWLNPQHEEMFAVNSPLKTLGIRLDLQQLLESFLLPQQCPLLKTFLRHMRSTSSAVAAMSRIWSVT